MQVKITFPGEFPTLNQIIEENKSHFAIYAKNKATFTGIVAWGCKKHPRPPALEKPVEVHFKWYRKNRRFDPDNIAAGQKYILDGLVEGKVLENDGWKQIKELHHTFEVDKKNPRVVVTLTEVEDD